MGHKDSEGHSRHGDGTFNSPGFGSSLDQSNAGINENDTYISATIKKDMATASHTSGLGGGGASAGGVGGAGSHGPFVISLIAILSFVWFAWLPDYRQHWADNVESWGYEWAINSISKGTQYAPHSSYTRYATKLPNASYSPKNIGIHADNTQAFPKNKSTDQVLASWGSLAWKCIAVDTKCLQESKEDPETNKKIVLLGFGFLKYAAAQGSADAMADLGLYIIGPEDPLSLFGFRTLTPTGQRLRIASEIWEKANKMDPTGSRAAQYLEQVQNSMPIKGSKLVANALRW